jgi:hypothetical protein
MMDNIDGGTEIERIRSSITDELREWAHGFTDLYVSNERQLLAIADRIDEHADKNALSEYMRGYNTGFDAASAEVESADELRERMEREYIKMPVDADGKVIHVEDEVELLDGSKRFKAEWLEWDGEDWVVHETIGYGAYHEPSSLRHVKPDSWERIIQDAVKLGYADYPTTCYEAELVQRCKRLAGE